MRKLQRFFWALAIVPFVLVACDKPKNNDEPENSNEQTENPGDNDTPGNTHSGYWDVNRGKIVTPSGPLWTSSTVREGITYYAFSGTDEVSGLPQKAFAVDIDLSNPNYKVLLTLSTSDYTSNIHKSHNAIATINAGYESGSIFCRVNGINQYLIQNSTISDTGQDNWKSEGAFFINSSGQPGMVFVGSPKRDGVVTGIKDGTYANACKMQRKYYLAMDKTEFPYILSSAPSLIDDFEPIGIYFCDYSISDKDAEALNSENLEHHQRVRHPRTAVALTENNHLILFVVDGRRSSRKGMSCRELTNFLVKWFNPQYALNLDGGGSTTMCVEGLGDSRNVVNSPIDGGTSGQERKRDTHIMIVPK